MCCTFVIAVICTFVAACSNLLQVVAFCSEFVARIVCSNSSQLVRICCAGISRSVAFVLQSLLHKCSLLFFLEKERFFFVCM
jgi:hypothetical protein